MNLQRITQADRAMNRLEARLGSLLERDLHAELLDAHAIVKEARQFAVSFDDAARLEENGYAEQAAQVREEAVTRLVQTLRPD